MSGSSRWPEASVVSTAGLLEANSSKPQVSQLEPKSAYEAECQQLDKEQLYVSLSTFWYCFLAFITALGLLVSLVSNTIIIYLFTKTPSLRRNPSNIIAVNLSLSDLLYCVQWPSVIYCSLTQSTWMLEIDLLCQTFGFFTVSTASASVLTVLAMSIERAIVIGYSLHAKRRFTIRGAWLIVLLIWIISICSSLPPLLGKFNRYTLDPSKTSCTLDYLSGKSNYKLYILALYIAYWIAPAILITICYVTIIVTFKRSSRSLRLVGERAQAKSACPVDNELATICDTLSEPATRQSSPLGWEFARRGGRQFYFKLSRGRLRDSIRLHNLVGSFRLRPRTRSGGQISTSSATTAPETGPPGDQLAARPGSSLGCTQLPGSADREAPIGATCATGKKLNLLSRSTGAKIRPHSHDRMQIGAEQPPLKCQGVTPHDHLMAAPSDLTRRVGDSEPEAADRNRQLAGAGRRHRITRGLSSLAGAVATRSSWPDSPHELDTFKDTVVQVTAGPPQGGPSGLRVGMRRARTSHDLRASKPGAGRMPDLSANLNLNLNPNRNVNIKRNSNRASGRPHRQSHMSTRTIGHLTAAGRQMAPRLSRQRHALTSGSSSSCHMGPSGAHFSRTGVQIRLAKMAFYLILLWFVSWTPIASLAMIHSVFKCQHRTSALAIFTANTMTKLGPTFDVFIYGISHPIIKSKFTKIIKWLFMIGRGSEQASRSNRPHFERSKQISMRSNIT